MDGGDCFGVAGGFRSADEKSVAIGIVESCPLIDAAVGGPVVTTCVTDIVGSFVFFKDREREREKKKKIDHDNLLNLKESEEVE